MTRQALGLGLAALAIAVSAFALVRGLRRSARAEPPPSASTALAPSRAGPLDAPAGALTIAAPPSGSPGSDPARSDSPAPERDPVPGVVWGFVLDPRGQPLEQAWLSFQDTLGERHRVWIDARGAYSIAGLAAGTWWALAGSIGHRALDEEFEVPTEQAPLRKDFVLEPLPRIDVRLVAPDGRPFGEVLEESGVHWFDLVPVATREDPGERFYEVEGSRNSAVGVGQFCENGAGGVRLPEGFLGSIFLEVDPPVFASLALQHLVLETERVESCPAAVAFTVDPAVLASSAASLRLQVVSAATGAPIAGALVHLDDLELQRLASDAAGQVALDPLRPGRVELCVMAEGFATHRAGIELQPGSANDLGEVALEPEVLVSGTVSGPDGEPLEADFTVGRLLADGTLDLDPLWTRSSDATGVFELSGLPAGRHVLQAEVQHGSPRFAANATLLSHNVIVDTRSGPASDLVVPLARAAPLTARWETGARRDLLLRFVDPLGLPRQWSRFHTAAPQRIALPPGTWKAEVLDPAGRVIAARTFTLGSEPVALVLGPDER